MENLSHQSLASGHSLNHDDVNLGELERMQGALQSGSALQESYSQQSAPRTTKSKEDVSFLGFGRTLEMGHKPLQAIDLFCGAGGMSLGFHQAGVGVAAAFDLEPWNVATHSANFPQTIAQERDLGRSSGADLLRAADLKKSDVDVVFGGPPCQGFSIGGKRDVDDIRNLLVYDFARIVHELKPRYFVMENVRGFLSEHSRPIRERFVQLIADAGYHIVEPIVALDASDFGVPQRRSRAFVLGYRKGQTAPLYPTALKSPAPCVKDAFDGLPRIEDNDDLYQNDAYFGKLATPKSDYAKLMAKPRSGKSSSRKLALTGCLRTKHSPEIVQRFKETDPGTAEPVSRYFRLHLNDLSPTIRAGTGRDHGSHTAPRPIHPVQPRCITAREAARLHSLPDWFALHGTRWHDFRQIGNSVPPMLAKAVARQIVIASSK